MKNGRRNSGGFWRRPLGQRALSVALSVAFVAGSLPSSVFAEAVDIDYVGESYSADAGELAVDNSDALLPENGQDEAALPEDSFVEENQTETPGVTLRIPGMSRLLWQMRMTRLQ